MSNLISVAKYICELLRDEVEPWAITGGCNLLFRGCASETGDIDIITSQKGVEIIAKRITGKPIKISKSESGNVRSYFYTIIVENTIIEIMGAPENRVHGIWIKNEVWPKLLETIMVEEIEVKAESLEYELFIQSFLGNIGKVELIKKCITSA